MVTVGLLLPRGAHGHSGVIITPWCAWSQWGYYYPVVRMVTVGLLIPDSSSCAISVLTTGSTAVFQDTDYKVESLRGVVEQLVESHQAQEEMMAKICMNYTCNTHV